MSGTDKHWRIWIDTGGTFTDCLALDPARRLHRAKVLSDGTLRFSIERSENQRIELAATAGLQDLPRDFFAGCWLRSLAGPTSGTRIERSRGRVLLLADTWQERVAGVEVDFGEEAPVVAARLVTRTPAADLLPRSEVRFATTRGTNALLEKRGEPPCLVVTRGFGDLLAIGNQQRPDIFALRIERPEPLYERVIEVSERVRSDGSVERCLDRHRLAEEAAKAVAEGARTAAVAFLHAYRNPVHELEAATILRDAGFDFVSTSSELSARIKIVPRAQTAVVDAYLARTIGEYLSALTEELRTKELFVMTSAGGLARASEYRAKDSLLSGPAGGVVGAAFAAAASGAARILAFDMGGTSTDVARHDGRFEYRSETVVGAARLASPSLAVETVAAGGGSICGFDGRQLKVGPQSAGADPGPACYGRGGPLTLTDVNLLLGRLPESHFAFTIDRDVARARAHQVWSQQESAGGRATLEEMLEGFLTIANEMMAGAVRQISLQSGYRPGDYALVAFGGAGPQHACALAELLGIGKALVPRDASLLSALGLGQSRLERFAELQVLERLKSAKESLSDRFAELRAEAVSALVGEGVDERDACVERREVFMRCIGQESSLPLDWSPKVDLEQAFSDAYQSHYGYRPEGRDLEVESLRLIAIGPDSGHISTSVGSAHTFETGLTETWRMYQRGRWLEGPVLDRVRFESSGHVPGPAWFVEEHTVTPIEPGWGARLDPAGALVLEKR